MSDRSRVFVVAVSILISVATAAAAAPGQSAKWVTLAKDLDTF